MIKDNGFVFLHRKFKDWEWYKNINVKTLFLHCLIMANFKDNNWQGIEIKRGSFITSISNLANETGLSDRQVRTAIDKLVLTNELTNKSTNKYRLITVLKYNQYQTLDKQDDNQLTIKRQTNDKQVTTTNKDNNLKNEFNEEEIKDNVPLPFNEIIEYLNKKIGNGTYRPTSQATQKHIKARFNEKYTLEDFYKVIDTKCNEWLKTDMAKFLRPETLFGSKFESYLNQPKQYKQSNKIEPSQATKERYGEV